MILVTGVNGQLGFDVVKELSKRGIQCKGIDIQDLDITNREDVISYIKDLKPESVIHCAAYTAVDKAEDDLETCEKVNVLGPKYIAEACKEISAKMMYISTDYVFEGTGTNAYKPNDPTNPQGAYGRTKLGGELAVKELLDNYFIVRISWVFGVNGNNFVKTMLRLGAEKDELNVIDDQIGSPTYTADLSVLLCDMIVSDKFGTYHASNEGFCSWADFAEAIMQNANLNCKINRIPTSEYKTRAVRPLNSRMDKTCLDQNGFNRLPTWKDALSNYLIELEGN